MAQLVIVLVLLFASCQKPPLPLEDGTPTGQVKPIVGRCAEYVQDVRTEHFKQFGLNFPYWYGVSQLEVESNCREVITAFDGGQGIAQFMPATTKYVCGLLGESLDPLNHDDAIRLQAFYMHRLHGQNPTGNLWLSYGFYNSGVGTMQKEAKKAGQWDYELMSKACSRNKILLKNGQVLDLCKVGYDYPKRIFTLGQKYRLGKDGIKFW